MKIISAFETLRARALRRIERLGFLAPTLIRFTLGLVFVGTGWGKLHSLNDVTAFFTSLGIPLSALNARVVAVTEFGGGLLLLLGFGTRLVALPMAFTMVVAILTAKRGDIDGVVTLIGFEEWSYLVMFLVIALLGAGPLSLDALLTRRLDARPREALPAAPTEV